MSELAHLLKSVVDVIDEHDGACDGEPTVRMSSMGIELLRRALGAYLDRPRSEAAKLPDEVEAMPESPSTFGCGHCGVTNRFEPRPAARARFSSMTPEEQKRWIDTGEAWPRRPDATHVFAADAVPDDVRRAHDIVRPCPGEAPRAPKTGLEGFDKWAAPMDGKHLLGHMVGQRTYPFTETAEYIDPPAGSFLDGFQYARQLRRERASRVSETTGKCATCHATGRNLTDGKQCPAEGCPAAPNASADPFWICRKCGVSERGITFNVGGYCHDAEQCKLRAADRPCKAPLGMAAPIPFPDCDCPRCGDARAKQVRESFGVADSSCASCTELRKRIENGQAAHNEDRTRADWLARDRDEWKARAVAAAHEIALLKGGSDAT
jgi:hypothetical protein